MRQVEFVEQSWITHGEGALEQHLCCHQFHCCTSSRWITHGEFSLSLNEIVDRVSAELIELSAATQALCSEWF